jgi:hypothetical protein
MQENIEFTQYFTYIVSDIGNYAASTWIAALETWSYVYSILMNRT